MIVTGYLVYMILPQTSTVILKLLDLLESSPYSYAGGDWKIVAGKVGVTRNFPPSSEVLPHCKMLTPIAALLIRPANFETVVAI
jgi:hypothetical protein